MATLIGSLYTTLTMNSASFIANTKKTADNTRSMARTMQSAFGAAKTAALGFLAAFSVDRVIQATSSALEYASGLAETASQLGVTTRELQAYSYAATQTGISQEAMEQGMARLQRLVGQARTGVGNAAETFSQLGIEVANADGSARSFTSIFEDVAARIAAIPDPARRAAVEVALFGKSGQQLAPLLEGGAQGVRQLTEDAERLGMVLSDSAINKADEAADKLAAFRREIQVRFAGVVAENSGAIITFLNTIVSFVSGVGRAIQALNRMHDENRRRLLEWRTQSGTLNAIRSVIAPEMQARDENELRNLKARMDADRFSGMPNPWERPKPQEALPGLNGFDPNSFRLKAPKPPKEAKEREKTPAETLAEARAEWEIMEREARESAFEMGQFMADSLGSLYAENAGGILDKVSEDTRETVEDAINDIRQRAGELAEDFATPFAMFAADAVSDIDSVGDAFGNLILDIKDLIIRELIYAPILKQLKAAFTDAFTPGASSGGGFLSGLLQLGSSLITGGGRRRGGNVNKGAAYLVGEDEPEWFVPSGSGRIEPMERGGTSIHVDARGSTDPAAVRLQVLRGIQEAMPMIRADAAAYTIDRLSFPSL